MGNQLRSTALLARRVELPSRTSVSYSFGNYGAASMKSSTTLGLIALILVAGCAGVPPDARFAAFKFDPSREHVGRIYHYLRSNRDNTLPEDVYVFQKSRTEIEVYKAVRRCTNAALVTADLDFERWSARRIVGGRLLPDARQDGFAVISLDVSAPRIDVVATLPEREVRGTLELRTLPWRLYDFDFAEFTIFSQHLRDFESGFSFEMAMIVPDPNEPNFLRRLGEARAVALGLDKSRSAFRYKLEGEAFSPGGTLLLDARYGHVVEVETSIPNHLEYDDFKLVLQSVEDGGDPAWRKLLTSHFEGCSPTN